MFDRLHFCWLLGREALGARGLIWKGIAAVGDHQQAVSGVKELNGYLRTHVAEIPALILCTSADALALSLDQDVAESVLPRIVDLEALARLAYISRREARGDSGARVILARMLHETGGLVESSAGDIIAGRSASTPGPELYRSLRRITFQLMQALRRREELQRYLRFELPAQRVLLSQARIPVAVDATEGERVAAELTGRLQAERVGLVRTRGVDPRDLLVSSTARAIFAGGYPALGEDEMSLGDFRAALESEDSELSERISVYLSGELSRRAVIQLVGAGGTPCQTIYDVNGTSTGRVTMRAPGIQWLEKRYRGLILAGDGWALRYLDYSCFEPTILAAASDDAVLTNACEGDLYEQVAGWLSLEGADSRDTAKEIWLRLMYGQAEAKIVRLLSARSGADSAAATRLLGGLRRELAGGIAFAEHLRQTAIATGFVRTPAGNRVKCDVETSYKALSLYLQSTGALIFKLALGRIFGGKLRARLVAPMHDAFLCAFPTDETDSVAEAASVIMQDAFEVVMGKRLARVVIRTKF